MSTSRLPRLDRRRLIATAGGAAALTVGVPSIGGSTSDAVPVALAEDASNDVPMFRGNAARTGVMPGPMPQIANGVKTLWNRPDIITFSPPALVSCVLYVGDQEGNFFALDADTGEERWRFVATEGGSWSPAEVASGSVFVGTSSGSESNNFYCLDAETGLENWRMATSRGSTQSAAIMSDIVYIPSQNVVALDLKTGEEVWTFENPRWSPTVTALDGVVYVGGFDRFSCIALDGRSGEELWTLPVKGDVVSVPVLDSGSMYVASGDGGIYSASTRSGEEAWRFDIGLVPSSPPVVHEGVVFASNGNSTYFTGNTICAISAYDGKELWRYSPENKRAVVLYPTLADDVLCIAIAAINTADNMLLALSPTSGDELWRIPGGISADPVISNGVIYLSSGSGISAFTALGPQLKKGGAARLVEDAVLRGGPSSTTVERRTLAAGTTVTIIGDREMTSATEWWPVSVDSTRDQGWIDASKLEALSSGPTS